MVIATLIESGLPAEHRLRWLLEADKNRGTLVINNAVLTSNHIDLLCSCFDVSGLSKAEARARMMHNYHLDCIVHPLEGAAIWTAGINVDTGGRPVIVVTAHNQPGQPAACSAYLTITYVHSIVR